MYEQCLQVVCALIPKRFVFLLCTGKRKQRLDKIFGEPTVLGLNQGSVLHGLICLQNNGLVAHPSGSTNDVPDCPDSMMCLMPNRRVTLRCLLHYGTGCS